MGTATMICENIDRLSPTLRPCGRVAGYHRWSNLLFVHWRLPVEVVRPLLPAELTLDTWDGDAWVGLVPFQMSGVRPWWSPPVPGISTFHETNVRTYVHFRGRDPGVWFFSLDASQSLAVRLARWGWHLPYFRARMKVQRDEAAVHYFSQRLWPEPSGGDCEIHAEIGGHLGDVDNSSATPHGHAIPGTLEHFLIERYILYARSRSGRLFQGRVYHTPYPLREARLQSFRETLLAAAGIRRDGDPCHVLFSEGVQVEVFPLVEIADHPVA